MTRPIPDPHGQPSGGTKRRDPFLGIVGILFVVMGFLEAPPYVKLLVLGWLFITVYRYQRLVYRKKEQSS